MKQMIALMALLLIQKNGQTTNKEIKEALRDMHRNDPAFKLYQSDVSTAMDEIAQEQGFVVKYDMIAGHQFRVFSLPQPVQPQVDADGQDDTDGADVDLSDAALSLVQVDSSGNLSDSSTPPTAGSIDAQNVATLPAGFGPQLDENLGDVTAYWSKDPSVYIQSNDKKTITKEMLNLLKGSNPGLKYDDIRVCSTKFYNKTVASR